MAARCCLTLPTAARGGPLLRTTAQHWRCYTPMLPATARCYPLLNARMRVICRGMRHLSAPAHAHVSTVNVSPRCAQADELLAAMATETAQGDGAKTHQVAAAWAAEMNKPVVVA